jgi:ABC-type polar amino acid transport system ATPase subunit
VAETNVLEARELAVRHGERELFAGVSFALPAGRAMVIMGGSGIGKTTLLQAIAGRKEHRGRLEIGGRTLPNKGSEEPDPNVVLVTQAPNLWSHLTAAGNIALVRRLLHGESKATAAKYAHDLLEHLECLGVADRFPHSLSGGEQQRISFARGLAAEKQLLLLDEVTSSMDAERKRVVIEVLKEKMREGVAVVAVSHDDDFGEMLGATTLYLTPAGLASGGSAGAGGGPAAAR